MSASISRTKTPSAAIPLEINIRLSEKVRGITFIMKARLRGRLPQDNGKGKWRGRQRGAHRAMIHI
jgi:hypothetical protein